VQPLAVGAGHGLSRRHCRRSQGAAAQKSDRSMPGAACQFPHGQADSAAAAEAVDQTFRKLPVGPQVGRLPSYSIRYRKTTSIMPAPLLHSSRRQNLVADDALTDMRLRLGHLCEHYPQRRGVTPISLLRSLWLLSRSPREITIFVAIDVASSRPLASSRISLYVNGGSPDATIYSQPPGLGA